VRSSPGYRSSVNQKQAACSMILIVPVTLHAVVRHYPQLAMKCHYLLVVAGLASMSYHVWMRQSKCLWCLVAAAALWIFLTLVSLAVPLRRRWGHSWPSVVISRHHELLSIDITVPSGWRVEPGQYVYLWLPQAGLRVASQLPHLCLVIRRSAGDQRHRGTDLRTSTPVRSARTDPCV
jgi:predicted ferric reductase